MARSNPTSLLFISFLLGLSVISCGSDGNQDLPYIDEGDGGIDVGADADGQQTNYEAATDRDTDTGQDAQIEEDAGLWDVTVDTGEPSDGGDNPDAESDGGHAYVEEPVDPQGLDFSKFDEFIEEFVDKNKLNGATAVIVHRDRGFVHLRGFKSYKEDRISLIASCSKLLSAGIMMRVADQGHLDPDAPISEQLDMWKAADKSSILPVQLVSNSSGIRALAKSTFPAYLCQFFPKGSLADCAKKIYESKDIIGGIEPDKEFRYGGAQWQLAGGVTQVASGKSWAELVEETYIKPCGAKSLGYTNQFSGSLTFYPPNFNGDVSKLPNTQNPNIEGGAYITVKDYGKILRMHLRGGMCGVHRVLQQHTVERMQQDRVKLVYNGIIDNDPSNGYGLGWWVPRNEPGVVYVSGLYGSKAWIDNTRGYAAMVIVEARRSLSGLRQGAKPRIDAVFDEANW